MTTIQEYRSESESESSIAVELRNLKVVLGKKVVFEDLNMSFERGRLTVVLGPPGAGKTTLLKTIAGFIDPVEGEVVIEGRVVNDVPPSQRNVSMVFQTLALYPHMTVYENIATPLSTRGFSKEEIDEKVQSLAKLLKITHTLDRKPETLSGGEYQRVAIAKCLIKDAQVYLMDEPFINLDLKIRSELRDEIKRLAETLKKTMIFATPDPSEALALGEKIYVFMEGKIVQFGQGVELYKMPKSLEVATYVGEGLFNIFKGEILRKGSNVTFATEDFSAKIPPDILADVPSEGKYTLVIRPEDIKPRRFAEDSYEFLVKGKVYTVEVLGGDTLVYYELDSGAIVKSLVNTIYRPSTGVEEELYFDPGEVLVFNEKGVPVMKWSKSI